MNETENHEKILTQLRRVIWLYFWLLLIEGALRKWIVPQLSTPLLVVRDPVVLLAYYLAIRAGIFPKNRWVTSLAIIAGLAFLITFIPLWLGGTSLLTTLIVDAYGFRCNFLHLPLIFIMAKVLRPEDVKKFGWWTLVLIGPMALLMVAQFNASPDSLLNRTASGEGEQIRSALGKVRTAGTFSFVTGVVYYFSLATGFLMWAALKRRTYPLWLLGAASSALLIGIVVSGSRSVVGACALVIASLLLVLFVRPSAVSRLGQVLVGAIAVGYILVQTPIFQEGFHVLSTRFLNVAESSEKSVSGTMIERVTDEFQQAVYILTNRAPIFGFGLGVGTNGGAVFLTGQNGFLLAEAEWSRVVLESGPLVGLSYIVWRCALAVYCGFLCLASAKKFGNVLPLLLLSSSAYALVTGQLGQPTILGFAVFATGLALAARNGEIDEPKRPTPAEFARQQSTQPRIGRRSAYAERLHGPGAPLDRQ